LSRRQKPSLFPEQSEEAVISWVGKGREGGVDSSYENVLATKSMEQLAGHHEDKRDRKEGETILIF